MVTFQTTKYKVERAYYQSVGFSDILACSIYNGLDLKVYTYYYFIDLDGTLVDTDGANNLAYIESLNSLGKEEVVKELKERLEAGKIKRIDRNYIKEEFKLDDNEIKEIVKKKDEFYGLEEILGKIKIKSKMIEELRKLQKCNKIFLVTNCRLRRVLLTLKYIKSRGYELKFEKIICREDKYIDDDERKGIIKELCQELGIKEENVITFKDTENANKYNKAVEVLKSEFIQRKIKIFIYDDEDIELEKAKEACENQNIYFIMYKGDDFDYEEIFYLP